MAYAILLDDNATYIQSVFAELEYFLRTELKIELKPFRSLKEMITFLEATSEAPRVAFIDLWLVDFEDNTSDDAAGFKAIDYIRGKWPNTYIIVVSSHLDPANLDALSRYDNKAVVDKDIPTSKLIELLRDVGVR